MHFVGLNELDVFFHEVETCFQVRQQIQELLAQRVQRLRHAAGKLTQRGLQLVAIAGVDHSEHGLGLRQVEASGQKRPQGEFPRLGQPRSMVAKRGQGCTQ